MLINQGISIITSQDSTKGTLSSRSTEQDVIHQSIRAIGINPITPDENMMAKAPLDLVVGVVH